MFVLKHLKTFQHVSIIIQTIFRELVCSFLMSLILKFLNHLTPNGHYMGRTPQLTSRCYILYIYSTNIRNEYFKHAA